MGSRLGRILGQEASFHWVSNSMDCIMLNSRLKERMDNRTVQPNRSNDTAVEEAKDEEEMNISQEILVLDFGDEKSDFLRSETDFGKGTYIDEMLLRSCA